MPTYQYACTACDERLEVVQKFSDDPLTECPVCHGRLRKLFSAVGVVFKGSGFYRTDSRAAANGGHGKGGSKDNSKDNGASNEKGESGDKSASADGGGSKAGVAGGESSSSGSGESKKGSSPGGSSTSSTSAPANPAA